MRIEINDKVYEVQVADTDEKRLNGLLGVTNLEDNEGMLFIYEEPLTVGYWMKDVAIPLDIIFIDEDEEVISVYNGKPNDTTIAEEDNVKYVLEVSANSGIKEGDELDIEDDDTLKMLILGSKGIQGEVDEGSRIVSRKETRVLIRKAKKANKTKFDSDYRSLGKYIFLVLDGLDSRDPLYVSLPK